MRRILGFCLLTGAAILVLVPQVLAQSGVISGPPLVNAGPSPPPAAGPPPPRQPSPSAAQPQYQQQRGEAWIAVAGGFDGQGRSVGVGFSGTQTSRGTAEDAAISACNRRGNGVSCRQAFAVSNGCLYIAPGGRRGGVTWGRGATRDLALDECRRGGYTCDSKRVIGGCLPGYSN